MKINLHTIAKRISSSKEMKKKKLEIKKRKWKNKTKKKKKQDYYNSVGIRHPLDVQRTSDTHWEGLFQICKNGR